MLIYLTKSVKIWISNHIRNQTIAPITYWNSFSICENVNIWPQNIQDSSRKIDHCLWQKPLFGKTKHSYWNIHMKWMDALQWRQINSKQPINLPTNQVLVPSQKIQYFRYNHRSGSTVEFQRKFITHKTWIISMVISFIFVFRI